MPQHAPPQQNKQPHSKQQSRQPHSRQQSRQPPRQRQSKQQLLKLLPRELSKNKPPSDKHRW